MVRRPMRRRAVVALSIGAIALATSCRSDLAGPTLRGNVATTEGLLSCKPLGYDSVTQTLHPTSRAECLRDGVVPERLARKQSLRRRDIPAGGRAGEGAAPARGHGDRRKGDREGAR